MEDASESEEHSHGDIKRDSLVRISHEIHGPLAGIRNNASFLLTRIEQLDKDSVLRLLNNILDDSELLAELLGNLDYLLGLERRMRQPTLVRLKPLILKAVIRLKSLLVARGFNAAQIEYQLANEQTVYADMQGLQTVVYGLLRNAILYADDDPRRLRVRIEAEETHDKYIIRFKDWGIGIKEQYAPDIFRAGFRTPEAIHKNIGGVGLGLAKSKQIMAQMRGDLKLANPSNPTEFHIVLPRKPVI